MRRAFDEINEFEAQQRDYGTLIVKLYFDVSADVQEQRLKERAADPQRECATKSASASGMWITHGGERPEAPHGHPLVARRIIDGEDEEEAALQALSATGRLGKAMPAEPPRLVSNPTRAQPSSRPVVVISVLHSFSPAWSRTTRSSPTLAPISARANGALQADPRRAGICFVIADDRKHASVIVFVDESHRRPTNGCTVEPDQRPWPPS